ncbi:calsenilin-like isoform X2 [Labeo rohita]|uniref:Calsenilin-like isoform X2 n=1 Tax=Labeo rohita TaxID=84645 RepID=A0A498MTF0_LABRO|nr:calsenilin-like isoform X2 [Labeo rohita]
MSGALLCKNEEDGKVVDGSLLGDANGVEPGTGRQKESGKWQRPRFTRKALMRCCLVKWIIASTGPKEQGTMNDNRRFQFSRAFGYTGV